MRTATLLAFVALAVPAFAVNYSVDLRPEWTNVQFTLSDPLHTVHGSFDLKRGHIDFSPDTGKASGEVVVDVTSGNSGSDARDSRMHANVLESKKYPEAVFIPGRMEGTLAIPGSSAVKLYGTFTIHGAPHEIAMDVQTSVGANGQMRATMKFELPYVSWGMKDPSNFLLKVSKTVLMTIQTTAPLDQH